MTNDKITVTNINCVQSPDGWIISQTLHVDPEHKRTYSVGIYKAGLYIPDDCTLFDVQAPTDKMMSTKQMEIILDAFVQGWNAHKESSKSLAIRDIN